MPDAAGEDDDRELDEEHRLPTERQDQRADEHHDRDVREPHAAVLRLRAAGVGKRCMRTVE